MKQIAFFQKKNELSYKEKLFIQPYIKHHKNVGTMRMTQNRWIVLFT